jgi:Family of unknown function (DUF5719)
MIEHSTSAAAPVLAPAALPPLLGAVWRLLWAHRAAVRQGRCFERLRAVVLGQLWAVARHTRTQALLAGGLGDAAPRAFYRQTYYLAGGVESSTEHATLDLLNTSAQRAHVGYTLYSQTGDTTRGTLTVGAHAARVVPVAGLTHLRGTFGVTQSADRPIAAQLDLTRKGRDGDTILATPGTARRWYLATGDTALTFHESVAILNPDRTRPAQVRLQLVPSGGGRSRTVTVRVQPHTHLVEDINSLLPRQSLSIIAEASRPVVVERRLTFSRDGHGHDYGLTTRLGTTTPAQLWLLAPGMPLPHLQTSLALLNPTTRTAHVTARFYGRSGRLLTVYPESNRAWRSLR